MRSDLAEKDVSRAMVWLSKNGCAVENFSNSPCPCCGQKTMRARGNSKSVVLPLEICEECKADEQIRTELGLPQKSFREWHKYNLLR